MLDAILWAFQIGTINHSRLLVPPTAIAPLSKAPTAVTGSSCDLDRRRGSPDAVRLQKLLSMWRRRRRLYAVILALADEVIE